MKEKVHESYWHMVWHRFNEHRLGKFSFYVVILFSLIGVYAPFLASSKPLFVVFNGEPFFPLFRYLFYAGFYTKRLDLFFNLMIFTLPLFILCFWLFKGTLRKTVLALIVAVHFALFLYLIYFPIKDPAADLQLIQERHQAVIKEGSKRLLDWDFDLRYMNDYAKLNLLLRNQQQRLQHERLLPFAKEYSKGVQAEKGKTDSYQEVPLPTLWQVAQDHEKQEIHQLKTKLSQLDSNSFEYKEAQAQLNYLLNRRQWLEGESKKLRFKIMPLVSSFHWEDDAGGQQALNKYIPWWELTRINRKDLLSALIFGVRISLTVGIISVGIALLIGVPIGAFAGYYGGRWDIVVSRLLEIWESMPVFFMLLMVVALLQSKSIFLVTGVIGFFSWTTFSRYVRGEFFKQRNLSYVEACKALGFHDSYIMFKHILPNAIPPVLTLLPFAIMAAITSEAGLSFLGLGEEGSASWGVLMDEGRTVFPQESYLLWPPAILLTILLVAIALVGDSLRDTLDPKLHR